MLKLVLLRLNANAHFPQNRVWSDNNFSVDRCSSAEYDVLLMAVFNLIKATQLHYFKQKARTELSH